MKQPVRYLFSLLLILLLFSRCEEDKESINDPTGPAIQLKTGTIATAPGDIFWIEATLSDDMGLDQIHLKLKDWYLDKYISLADSAPTAYSLRYQFLTPESATQPQTLKLSVKDIGGNTLDTKIPITLDKDVEAPQFLVKSPANGQNVSGGDAMDFFIEITDNQGIDTFQLSAPALQLDTLVAFDPVNPRYIYVGNHTVPADIADGSYTIELLATDSTGNRSTNSIAYTVGTVSINQVYIVGGASFGGWDPSNPMPMKPDPDNEGWYEILTYSWGLQDQNGVKFIGQKSWSPLNWGLNPDDPTQMVNSESSEKIILEEAGYYRVRFNPTELDYSVEKTEVNTPVYNDMYVLGSGIIGMDMAWDSPSGALPMTPHPDNPYLLLDTLEFSDTGYEDWGANFIFIADKNDLAAFNLGFTDIPEQSLDPDWLDYPGYVVGDLAMWLQPLTAEQLGYISDDPPNSVWNNVPYIAYYQQAGTYAIQLDYHSQQVSITQISN